jgi:uncharacterized membrane protein YfcA
MHNLVILLLGLGAGILVGLMGIGGGTIVVPLLVYLLGMGQHMAQGTSLFMQLLPVGLGALWVYWKAGEVDLRAGIVCALGILVGGFAGGSIAITIPARRLQALFGLFLMVSAVLLWRQAGEKASATGAND